MTNITYYIALLLMIIIGFIIVKKVAGCLIRTVIIGALAVLLGCLYYFYFK
ncbi:MAG: hypothetical protein J6B91_11210 [Prevotella sp.]|nr:hypothetical protein [Prevotella sp.]